MFTYVSFSLNVELAQGILWCLHISPIIELLLSLSIRAIGSFFSNIWTALSFSGVQAYISQELMRTNRPRWFIIAKFCGLGLLIMTFFLITVACLVAGGIERGGTSLVIVYGILAVIVPVAGFFRILSEPWKFIINHFRGIAPPLLPDDYERIERIERSGMLETTTAMLGSAVKDVSLFDPSGLMRMKKWGRFIAGQLEPIWLHQITPSLVAGILAGLIHIAYVVLDIYRWARSTGDVSGVVMNVCLTMRTLINVFVFPYIFLSNMAVLFLQRRQLSTRTHIRRVKVTSFVIIMTFFAVFLIGSLIVISIRPFILEELKYIAPTGQAVTTEDPRGLCDDSLGGFSLLAHAGLAMVAQHISDEPAWSIINPMMQYLAPDFPAGGVSIVTYWGGGLPAFLVVDRVRNVSVLAFQGIANRKEMGILWENVIGHWYSVGITSVIPFLELMNDLFLAPVLSLISLFASTVFIGLTPVSLSYERLGNDHYDWVIKTTGRSPTLIGHMSGGLIAKAVGTRLNERVVAFESPMFSASLLDRMNLSREYLNFVNVYSSGSLFTMQEDGTVQNVFLPQYQSLWKPANPYETFCVIAAGCVVDDRYDQLCGSAVGDEKYVEYFRKWNRNRTPLNRPGETQETQQ
jgi:hypothetical protein